MGNLCVALFYVTYHVGEIRDMGFGSFSEKPFSEMSYEVRRCMTFDSNELGHGLNHDIVCRNEAIFRTLVYLRWRTVLTKGFFIFFLRKTHFSFSEYRNCVFCEAATKTANRMCKTTMYP